MLSALAVGAASALVPVVNAEVVALGVGATSTVALAAVVALALAIGQTAGKLVIFSAARHGSTWRRKKRIEVTPTVSKATAPPRRRATRSRAWHVLSRRWAGAGHRAMAVLDSRWRGGGVVLLSASVGLPPLALVSAGCGLARTRRSDFAACCLAGRSIRFLSLSVPLAVWSG